MCGFIYMPVHISFCLQLQITNLIVANIDEGSLNLKNTTTAIPEMPAEPVKLLQDVYEKIRFNFDLIQAVT